MRDKRSTNEKAERSGVKIGKNLAENGALGTPEVRGDEGEVCEGIATTDARDEGYEVKHCSETEKMPNQVARRLSRME